MYNSQDKSYYNSHSNRSTRPCESKRWDHSGYYQLQTDKDQKYKYDDKFDKYRKPRRFQNDNAIAYNIVDSGPPKDQKTMENYKEVIVRSLFYLFKANFFNRTKQKKFLVIHLQAI